jgi:pectin methylesterase-like acyl-CoA thioesterase
VCPGSTETAFLIIDARHLKEKGRKVVVLGRSHAADANYDPTFLENSLENPAILRQRAP